ncbi:MAG: DUF6197 family protein [Actinomycetota bacterium]
MDAYDVLLKAQELIRSPEHWCQGVLAKDRSGMPTVNLKAAYSRCSLGALKTLSEQPTYQEGAALYLAAWEMGFRDVSALNDSCTHEQVMQMFDRAREIVASGAGSTS